MLTVTFEHDVEANIDGADVVQREWKVKATGVAVPSKYAAHPGAVAITDVTVTDRNTGAAIDIEGLPEVDDVWDAAEARLEREVACSLER